MEKIDLTNYEAYFLDFMEGTLSAEEKHDLWAFLTLHPELKAEMEADFGAVELLPEKVVFEEKENLKIDAGNLIITANTVDDLMVASVEGQLTKKHEADLQDYVKRHNLTTTFAYYKATVLKPDAGIVYEEKEKLKVKTGVVISMRFITRVAAAAAVGIVLVTLAISNWNNPGTLTDETPNFMSDAKSQFVLERLNRQIDVQNDTENELDAVPESNEIRNNRQPDKQENNLLDQFRQNDLVKNDPIVNKDTSGAALPNNKMGPDVLDKNIIPKDEFVHDKNPKPISDDDPLPILPEDEVIYASVESRIKREEPYKIVTDFAGDIVNRDIEFTRNKDLTSNDYVSYGFKVGKFEFERKRSK